MDRFEEAGTAVKRLCEVMARLRAPGGCPWDAEQTLDSLKPYLIEEAYEVLEALELGRADKHREELGDLLLQVVFQAEVRAEDGTFDMAAVARAITDKLVRRHPHVFGDTPAEDADGALRNWEAIKAQERSARESVLDGIPGNLPALLRAMRAGEKAAAVGFDWPSAAEVEAKVHEEWQELHDAADDGGDREHLHEELGDLLFAVVNWARHLGLDAEAALRDATGKFSRRFRFVEQELAAAGKAPADESLEELERLWQQAKARERER